MFTQTSSWCIQQDTIQNITTFTIQIYFETSESINYFEVQYIHETFLELLFTVELLKISLLYELVCITNLMYCCLKRILNSKKVYVFILN